MNKEIQIPQGFYRVGRDIPAGVYLLTSLNDDGYVGISDGTGSYESFFLNSDATLSCQIEVAKGDKIKLEGKIKIKRIGDFPYATKDEPPAEKPISTRLSAIKTTWDENLSKYYSGSGNSNSRLQRGLEYFRQGRVEDLFYGKGMVTAYVKGSDKSSYEVCVYIDKANAQNDIMPTKEQISFECNCPDSAKPCKHIAAVLYAISNDLERNPYILYLLRDKSI